MSTQLQISNRGQEIASTNFWYSDYAKEGLFFLSWNAGAVRLLVPDLMLPAIAEMRTSSHAVISRGRRRPHPKDSPDVYEILFEDGSDAPYVLQLGPVQTDRLLPKSEAGREIPLLIWTRTGEQLRMPALYKCDARLPTIGD